MPVRIPPIEKPRGIFRKVMYYLMRKQYGKVIMPAKVIYARYPKIGLTVKKLLDTDDSFKLISTADKCLIQTLVATLNDCSFCIDIAKRKSMDKAPDVMSRFAFLMDYETSPHFSEKEKAMLAYAAEMTRNIAVSDEGYERLKQYYSDEEIIEITYTAAAEAFLNRLNKPLGISSDELCSIR